MNMRYIAAAALCAVLVSGCKENKFKITGSVYDGSGQSVVLEKADYVGRWIPVDSTRIGGNGEFSISAEAPASPEIYRLSMGDRFIYLPVDSIETLNVETSKADFGHKFTLSGTDQAKRLADFEQELIALNATDSAALADFKRNVYSKYIQNAQGSIVSYNVLTKIVGDRPLYDPVDPADAKYYAAVATQFDTYKPHDPHGQMVKDATLQALRQRNKASGKKRVIEANEVKVLDIALQDAKGRNVKLSDYVGKGKKVVVIFGMMNEPESPALNRELAKLYNSRGGAVEFFDVSLDQGQYEWREASKNLPWVNVIDPQGTSSTAMRDYNVVSLPSYYIYNEAGELVDRALTVEELGRKI